MKKTLFVVEGQTELIFVQRFLQEVLSYTLNYEINMRQLKGGRLQLTGRDIKNGNQDGSPDISILIVDVQGDDQVRTYMGNYLERNVGKIDGIFGLRDKYTGDRKKKPLDVEKNKQLDIETSARSGLRFSMTIAVEEIEAWFLSQPQIFKKIHDDLSESKVFEVLKFDPSNVDVETIDHPAGKIDKVLKEVGLRYKKNEDQAHKIAGNLMMDDLYVEKSSKISSLRSFVDNVDFATSA